MNTAIGYKLFRTMKTKPGKLFPLYVNANKEVPIGEWLKAEEGPRDENGKVKSRLGSLAYRPGWHINDEVPYVTHIGEKGSDGTIQYMRSDLVWCEVEYCTNHNYQDEANARGINKKGILVPKMAQLDKLPVEGYYKYKTNPNMFGEWIIAGEMKVNRIMSDNEVEELCKLHGLVALPRKKAS